MGELNSQTITHAGSYTLNLKAESWRGCHLGMDRSWGTSLENEMEGGERCIQPNTK